MAVAPINLGSDLTEGPVRSSAGTTYFQRTGPGEGGFRFDLPTVGFVLKPLPSHSARYGDERTRRVPLISGAGWVLPAGVDGWCDWATPSDFLNIELGSAALAPGTQVRIGQAVEDPLIVQLALAAHRVGPNPDDAAALYRDTLLVTLGAHIARSFGGVAPLPVRTIDPRLGRAIAVIEDGFAEPQSLEALAAVAGMSPFHFAKSFKGATGLAPYQYLVKTRIERAQVLLRTTRLPIAEIAVRVGIEKTSQFIQLFRRLTGATPGEFRGPR